MRRRAVVSLLALGGAFAIWLWSQAAVQPEPIANLFPAGSLLYIEARDFRGLLSDWNNSSEKKLWLTSDNYQVFSRTNLFLKLADAQQEFAQAAGFLADFPMVQAVAGQNAALAIYNIGELEFLYVTRIEASAALESVLLQRRTSYESRNSAGKPYHVRRQGKRTAAFAFTDGLLLLATREDLVASALKLLARQQQPAMVQEDWFVRALRSQPRAAGEIRMVLNLRNLVETPQFRSYWIQRNVSALRPFRAGIIDMFRERGKLQEERVLIRDESGSGPASDDAAVAQVLAWAPDDVGLRRAWASPACADMAELLQRRIVAPGPTAPESSRTAPVADSPDTLLGTTADLEVRVDEQPLVPSALPGAFGQACESTRLRAVLHVQRSKTEVDGVYVGNESAIALLGDADWQDITIPGAHVRRQGRTLVVASTPEMLGSVASRLGNSPAPVGAFYSARYSHARELEPFRAMMSFIDTSKPRPEYANASSPQFFSGNVASLGQVLSRLQSVDVTVRSAPDELRQLVVYTVR